MPHYYRYEIAKQGRAGCRNTACKKENIKIQKGELRFGVLVTIYEHTSWMWKHWGCVSPQQIENIVADLGGLDGLDLDKDLDILDGYDELEPWAQEKIKYSLEHGHVHDDDWKGEPELNRPGMKGINKRTPKKKKAKNADGGDENESDGGKEDSLSKAKKGEKKKKKRPSAEDDDEDDEDAHSPTPKRKAGSRKRKSDAAQAEDDDPAPAKRKRTAKASKVKAEDIDSDEPLELRPKKKVRGEKHAAIKAEAENTRSVHPQANSSDEAKPVKAGKKGRGKKAVKVEDEAVANAEQDDFPAAKPTKAGKSKKVKAEPVKAEDDEPVAVPDEKVKKRNSRSKVKKDDAQANGVTKDEQEEAPKTQRGRKRRSNA